MNHTCIINNNVGGYEKSCRHFKVLLSELESFDCNYADREVPIFFDPPDRSAPAYEFRSKAGMLVGLNASGVASDTIDANNLSRLRANFIFPFNRVEASGFHCEPPWLVVGGSPGFLPEGSPSQRETPTLRGRSPT